MIIFFPRDEPYTSLTAINMLIGIAARATHKARTKLFVMSFMFRVNNP